MFKRVPGTKDILPEQISLWQKVEEISRKTFAIYNYHEIRPPLIEDAGLFNRSLGQSSEVVTKQMFFINCPTEGIAGDNTQDLYALRPEATASIARAYIENNLDKTTQFAKLYYIGPMFRRERPQKGRLRQFHHIGCEAIGSFDPGVDVEVISLADTLLLAFGVSGYLLKINSLGCSEDKKKLAAGLKRGLENKLDKLCQDCHLRFERNVLRILDCKNEGCRRVVGELGINDSNLCGDCSAHFAQVKQGLDMVGIKYEVSNFLVRGLDYYTRTVFEFTHEELGPQQDALGAGGRYDTLISELGGPAVGATGFAFGMERLMLVTGIPAQLKANNLVFIVTLGEPAKAEGLKLLKMLRSQQIACDTDYEGKSLKGAMRRANDLAARFVLILGDNELKNKSVMLKDMSSGKQKEVKVGDLVPELQ